MKYQAKDDAVLVVGDRELRVLSGRVYDDQKEDEAAVIRRWPTYFDKLSQSK